MSTALAVDRPRVCAFISPGGRGCTMPLSHDHPFLCTYHARKEAQASAAKKVGEDIAYSLSTRYVSHNDLAVALAQTISAVAQRHISTRMASNIANLSRTLVQAVAGAQHEYIETFGEDAWTDKIAANLSTLRPRPPVVPPPPNPAEPDEDSVTEPDSEAADEQEPEDQEPPKAVPIM